MGHSNRGKTYILNKLSDTDLECGYQVQTKGISIKIPKGRVVWLRDQNILILDTQGTNTSSSRRKRRR